MALNGFLQSGTCYQDLYGAYAAYVSKLQVPASSSTTLVQLNYNPLSVYGGLNGHYQYDYFSVSPLGSLVYLKTVSISAPVFPVCDPLLPFQSGAFLGATVGGAFITVSLVALLRRAL